jgi:carboxyl-terminal processing protease
VFHSDAGRPVYGGGGITPDVLVREDTLNAAERALLRALSTRPSATNQVLSEYTLELMNGVRRDFSVGGAWRDEVFRRLQKDGVRVDRPTFDAGATLLDRMLEQRVSALAFGDSASFRRNVPRDRPLQTALEVLHGARTQAQALVRAATLARATAAPAVAAAGPRG